MGFFSKQNPKATWRSVLLRVLTTCTIAAGLWGAALWFRFNPDWKPSWTMFILWMTCAVISGAVIEWQVDEEFDQSTDGGATPDGGASDKRN